MTGPLADVDAGTAELILSMPCASDDDVRRWFGLVQECHRANPNDFTAFASTLRAKAGTFDSAAVETFLERAKATGGMAAVSRVLNQLPAKAQVYWQVATPQRSMTTTIDLERIAAELVRQSIADVDGAGSLSESDLADVIAVVRENLEAADE